MNFYWYCFLVILISMWLQKRWNERHAMGLIKYFPYKKYQIVLGFGPLWGSKVLLKKFIEVAGQGQNVIQYSGPQILFFTSDPETLKDILTSKLCISKPEIIYSGVVHSLGNGLITAQATITGRDLDKANVDITDSAKKISEALEFSSEFTSNFIYLLPITRLFARMTTYKEAWAFMAFLDSLLTESLYTYKERRGIDPSFLDSIHNILLETIDGAIKEKILSEDEGMGVIRHVLFGAFETSSSTTYNTLLLLAMHPEIQQRAYEEICDVFHEDDEGNFTVTYDHLSKLPYLGMIANEAMRLWPVVPQAGRKLEGGSLKLSSGVVLPEGLNILIDMYSLHRNKEIWGNDADKFNPDHFLPSNNETRHPYAFLPFTKGNRFCIGMRYGEINVKLTLARLLKRYKFSTTAKLDDIQFENHIVMQILNHPEVTVQKRERLKTQ
ncbi:putative cytochrome P450 313a4 isoform X2 [Haematobia irritans]|uniref:putative cytochrome P450 313a4 isoform X2 n=1 Tax=Haematobia irritans TaxID=7368 RepID=UPI003F4F7C86